MKRLVLGILYIAISFLLISCAASPYVGLRDANRKNIQNVHLGDSSSSVVGKMGEASTSGMSGTVTNPYKKEAVQLAGVDHVIWYYYTEQIGYKSWEEGMTPIVFVNDKVIAIGWRALERLGIGSDSTFTVMRR